MEQGAVVERIKNTARNTDALIAKLDSLAGRVDAAKASGNEELAQYYEGQFTEVSVEFMDSVESILDCWYDMRGVQRPPAETEDLSPEDLDGIHGMVVDILHGLQPDLRKAEKQHAPAAVIEPSKEEHAHVPLRPKDTGPKHKVDLTG